MNTIQYGTAQCNAIKNILYGAQCTVDKCRVASEAREVAGRAEDWWLYVAG